MAKGNKKSRRKKKVANKKLARHHHKRNYGGSGGTVGGDGYSEEIKKGLNKALEALDAHSDERLVKTLCVKNFADLESMREVADKICEMGTAFLPDGTTLHAKTDLEQGKILIYEVGINASGTDYDELERSIVEIQRALGKGGDLT